MTELEILEGYYFFYITITRHEKRSRVLEFTTPIDTDDRSPQYCRRDETDVR
jgi:hypothetical protein